METEVTTEEAIAVEICGCTRGGLPCQDIAIAGVTYTCINGHLRNKPMCANHVRSTSAGTIACTPCSPAAVRIRGITINWK